MSLPSDSTPSAMPPAAEAAPAAVTGEAKPRDGLVAFAGMSLAATALLLVAVGTVFVAHQQSITAAHAETRRINALASSLTPAVETSLAGGDLASLRLLLTDSIIRQDLSQCRLILPDGQTIVSIQPGDRAISKLPAQWTDRPPPGLEDAGQVTTSRAIAVTGRGTVHLQVAATMPTIPMASWVVAGTDAAASLILFAMMATYRRSRTALAGALAVRDVLISMGPAAQQSGRLIDGTLGPECTAWNALMSERERIRKDSLAERARELLGRRKQARGDLDAACDAMSQGLILVDEMGRVKYANNAAASYLRTDREKLLSGDLSSVIDMEKIVTAVRDVASGQIRRRVVIDMERAADPKAPPVPGEGGAGVLRFSVRPVRREDAASAMVVIEDITQQRAAEAARHSFVAQATHELRTPLTNIRLYVETAIEDGENDPGIRTKALNVINGEARRLERIVGEMLSVAEIEAGAFKLKVDDVRLDVLFDELRHDYNELAKEKKIALSFVLPPKWPVLTGDRDKVAVVLHNLVGNALKYTPSNGSVTVRVDCDDKEMSVAVTDTGIGIAADECERVFERFFRSSDGRVARITGTGLGLTIAREAARLHGGDIKVESQLNKGSTFTLTLPLRQAA